MKKMILRALALSLTAMMLLASTGLAATLELRDKGDAVITLQTALKQLGYYEKDLDGNFGSGTLAAVKAFQEAEGLKVDGKAGKLTQAKLTELTGLVFVFEDEEDKEDDTTTDTEKPAPTGLFAGDYRTMQFGTAGNRVRILQRALLALGFTVKVDGDFGSSTHKAVKAFQTVVGLTSDGKAGKKTLQKLENYFDEDGNCTSGPIAGNTPAKPEPDPDAPTYGMPERTLRSGATGLDVKYVMQRLYDLEYYNKKVDEKFGSGMLAAVKAFQRKNSLTVDGVVGPTTLKTLFSDSALDADDAVPPVEEEIEEGRTLAKGMKGEDVKAVQVRLTALGYYEGKLDGIYGNGTRESVRLFQARNGLKVDGKVGPRTLAKLLSTDAVPAESGTVVVPGTGTVIDPDGPLAPDGDG